jgi:hypothetical protein
MIDLVLRPNTYIFCFKMNGFDLKMDVLDLKTYVLLVSSYFAKFLRNNYDAINSVYVYGIKCVSKLAKRESIKVLRTSEKSWTKFYNFFFNSINR